ncbi:hypothetical protein [Rathayibacter soli]|uniref:hypothetical protein n=1 Tax=Rathayibacter soli TaxID=3144168 RepID=UPI0027E5B2D6|nr:hypothetical protein [Glaciibacter superstes]
MSLRPNYRVLIDGMDIMLGTSARVECIGLCRCDVDMTASPPTLLFQTATGLPMSVSNYEWLLRSFVDDNGDALTAIGVDSDRHSTHIYRRTVATLVEQAVGITLASRLLGHAN